MIAARCYSVVVSLQTRDRLYPNAYLLLTKNKIAAFEAMVVDAL